MSITELAKLQAPVAYAEVRQRVNTVRTLFGVVLVAMATTGIVQGMTPARYVIFAAIYLACDGIWRRTRGNSALPMLLTDTVVFCAISMVKGNPALGLAVTFVYIVTGALLLLPLVRAASATAAALVLGIPVVMISPLGDPVISSTRYVVFDIVVMTLMSLLIGSLLYGAVQALHAATLRNRDALAAERRAVELKDEFVSMVSHEFRTPLTSIAGFSETLRANWPDLDPEEISEFLVIMRQEAQHLSNLVEDILVIPRIEAGRLRLRPQEFDLAAEIAATSRLVFAGASKEVNTYIPSGVMVNADRGRVGQILRNLFDNARKYGGDSVKLDGEAGTDLYTITVADNGPGIPDDDWERIFEHFEQVGKGDARQAEGVGLGLPIARQLARAMGGDVWYEPRFPTGAAFKFSMRLARVVSEGDLAEPAEVEPAEPTEV